MKGYLVDSGARIIRPVDYDYRGSKSISRIIGASLICTAWRWHETGDALFVDEEGMLSPCENFFRVTSRPDGQPLAGNGLLCGRDDIDTTFPPSMTIEELRREVEWLGRSDFEAWAKGRGPDVSVTTEEGTEVLETWDGLIAKVRGE